MKRRALLNSIVWLPLLQALPAVAAVDIHVYKTPDCGCCAGWVDHLKAEGFSVTVTEVADTSLTRKRLGMPERFGSCHTALVEGYVLEGHVPAAEVGKLLASRPKAIGLAVPGMPAGSPGMEMGARRDQYKVLLVDRNGHDTVFATYPK
ncbi:DUF411 domain-containing protein [Rhodoferax sediminis]|uniref:DUF411 domain-containing protein n=1 Tax=Rhodoferax sediminis TaxID=2509614 RepID=A0A515D866_9BURK|nr:DUF411 domain-containing protein [Rhodoferax sediminis]